MKSIKEKSEEYGYTNWQSDEYHDGASEGLEFDPIGHTQKTFEAGANYVLEQISQALYVMLMDIHHGNCRFCKERRLKELEELVKLKEK